MFLPRVPKSTYAFVALLAITASLMVLRITAALDNRILDIIGSWRTPWWTSLMRFAELLGDGKVEIPLALFITAVMWVRGRPAMGRRYFAVCLSAEAVYFLAKLIFHRPRPTVILHLGQGGWYSFPSGHATLATVVWGLGLVVLAELVSAKWARVVLWIAAIAVCLWIDSCRLYLGVHYPTDVLAGIFLGMAWTLWWWKTITESEVEPEE